MSNPEIKTIYPRTIAEWRDWLSKNHQKEEAVWVICYKSGAGMPTVNYEESVEEALCYGWIDSKAQALGDGSRRQFFSRRKPKSVWAKSNKARVEKLIAEGRMKEAGMKSIETAKANGSWDILTEVEALKIPDDLSTELTKHPEAKAFFDTLSKSVKQNMLQWLVLAKREETRKKRIAEIVDSARDSKKPKQF